jgi:hypothetical protein
VPAANDALIGIVFHELAVSVPDAEDATSVPGRFVAVLWV